MLADWDLGRWAGRTLDDVAAGSPEAVTAWLTDPEVTPHGGESLSALVDRDAAVAGERAGWPHARRLRARRRAGGRRRRAGGAGERVLAAGRRPADRDGPAGRPGPVDRPVGGDRGRPAPLTSVRRRRHWRRRAGGERPQVPTVGAPTVRPVPGRVRAGARGNPVRVRDCPAAVSGNERRHDALGGAAPGKRRPVGPPGPPGGCPRVRRPAAGARAGRRARTLQRLAGAGEAGRRDDECVCCRRATGRDPGLDDAARGCSGRSCWGW